MKKILSVLSLALIFMIGQFSFANTGNITFRDNVDLKHVDTTLLLQKNAKNELMCFKKSEEISGLNKICYYDCAGSTAAITIKSYELCPLNINR